MSNSIIAALSVILCDCPGGKEIVIMVPHAVHPQIPGNLCSQQLLACRMGKGGEKERQSVIIVRDVEK